MPDINQNITVRVTGDDAAAASIGKVTQAFAEQGVVHEGIKNKFSQSFEHVGVHIFGHQLLELIGIHGQVRPLITLMNVAVMETAGTFGLAASAIFPYILGLGALAAIVYKVTSGHKDHTVALEEHLKKTDEVAKKYHETLKDIEAYEQANGTLTKSLIALKTATEDVFKITTEKARADAVALMNAKAQRVAAIDLEIDKWKEYAEETEKNLKRAQAQQTANAKELEVNFKAATDQIKKLKEDRAVAAQEEAANIEKAIELGKGVVGGLKEETKVLEEVRKAAEKLAEARVKATEQYEQFEERMFDRILKIQEQTDTSQFSSVNKKYDAMRNEVNRFFNEEEERLNKSELSFNQLNNILNKMDQQRAMASVAIERAALSEREKLLRQFWGVEQTQTKMAESALAQTFKSISAEWSKNITAMIFEGEKWRQNFGQILKDIVKTFFEAMLQMEIRYLAFSALTGMGFVGAPAAAGTSGGALPGFAKALGGTQIVDRPTLFLAGEAGPEKASFTPLTGGSEGTGPSSGGGESLTIGSIVTHVHGIQDPKAIADKVGLEIIRKIRGSGQLNFVRTA